MSEQWSYWTQRTIRRRPALRGAAVVGGGLAALGLAGCGSSKRGPGKANQSLAAVDSTKGKPGGRLIFQTANYHGGLALVTKNSAAGSKVIGLAHNGLLAFRYGRPIVPGTDVSVEPDLAQALPEQPDPTTYVFKLKPAQFHNGRTVTAEDVKYSYERYASFDGSVRISSWVWLDHVETPDALTAVVKTKTPFAEALQSMSAGQDAYIMAKEFEESSESPNKLMGTGPYLFVSDTAPVSTAFRRNPNYFDKPYPYFDEVVALGTADPAKRIADFVSGQVHWTHWFSESDRDQIKKGRPDGVAWTYPKPGLAVYMRTDRPPFNDKRVRQALSMTIDRKKIREAVSEGEGEDDQALSIVNVAYGFRKPKDLGAAAKNWKYDPQTAKQLLSAAGVSLPIDVTWSHWDASSTGQAFVDHATLAAATWRELGIANVREINQTQGQYFSTTAVGAYEGMAHVTGFQAVAIGKTLKDTYWAPPGGVHVPTQNAGYVSDSRLNELLEKELTQLNLDERQQTFRQIEDLLADEQYRIVFSTFTQTYFTDPALRDLQVPAFAFAGSAGYTKYWWFDRA